MVILYNPKTGSTIEKFVFNGVQLSPHPAGELKQYEENVAKELLNTFGFLEVKTAQQAQEILNKPKEATFKCEYCDFSTDVKVALSGHSRTHQAEIARAKEPQVDPAIIPVAEGTKVEPKKSVARIAQDDLLTSPDFYGPGVTYN